MVTDDKKIKKIQQKDIKPLHNQNGHSQKKQHPQIFDTRFQTKDAAGVDASQP